MEERKTRYVVDGYDNRKNCYIITEMYGYLPVYCYDGYPRGNVYHLYPRKSLCKGERRDKRTVSVHEVQRSGNKKTTYTSADQSSVYVV